MLPANLFKKLKRGPQVITLKDAALISGFTGLQSGDRVVDAGAGSGFLAIYLGSMVAPSGKVFSYEWREEFAKLAEKNVEKTGLKEVVEIKRKNIFDGVEENEIDLITLDLADAEKVLEHAAKALKEEGWIVGYFPNVEQAKDFVEAAERIGLKHVKTVESLLREMLIRREGCRPQTKGLLHTGYLCFLRK
ncbi:methyltransferase domain-containing protein [Candidatus Micrarchaeota archaeon]|nr:methyltransferase domain-containing protein [Candidatus Micrarchaeota archaeon]